MEESFTELFEVTSECILKIEYNLLQSFYDYAITIIKMMFYDHAAQKTTFSLIDRFYLLSNLSSCGRWTSFTKKYEVLMCIYGLFTALAVKIVIHGNQ